MFKKGVAVLATEATDLLSRTQFLVKTRVGLKFQLKNNKNAEFCKTVNNE